MGSSSPSNKTGMRVEGARAASSLKIIRPLHPFRALPLSLVKPCTTTTVAGWTDMASLGASLVVLLLLYIVDLQLFEAHDNSIISHHHYFT